VGTFDRYSIDDRAAARSDGRMDAAETDPPVATANAAPPAEARQFDFWVGEWEVFDPEGRKVGENSIRLAHGGWVLIERWRGAGGLTGSSLSAFHAATPQHWTQYWADSSGGELFMKGRLVSGSMVLEERSTDAQGRPVVQRTTWTPNPGGTLRQHWQTSHDGGASWQTTFDGTYRRKPGDPCPS
jgi:hypothetical protein